MSTFNYSSNFAEKIRIFFSICRQKKIGKTKKFREKKFSKIWEKFLFLKKLSAKNLAKNFFFEKKIVENLDEKKFRKNNLSKKKFGKKFFFEKKFVEIL